MEVTYVSTNPAQVQAYDFAATDYEDNEPVVSTLGAEEPLEWLTSCEDKTALRILVLQKLKRQTPLHTLPFTQKTYETAIHNPGHCLALTQTRAGGCTAFLDDPWRVVLQSPDVPGPWFSLVLGRKYTIVSGIYLYSDDAFHPATLLKGEQMMSGRRREGIHIVSLPQALAKAHANYMWKVLYDIVDIMENVEAELIQQSRIMNVHSASAVLFELNTQLQDCAHTLLQLERRGRFHDQVLDSIAAIVDVYQVRARSTTPWPGLVALRSQTRPLSKEFDSLSKRILNAQSTIAVIVQQRNAQSNLEISESSRRMAEATLQDSASMKTIAVLTMVFLPGTAVASFFSMSMFDWSASSGSHIASDWIWIFFALAIPLTGVVLALWYVIGKRNRIAAQMHFQLANATTTANAIEIS
ncbi:hypothetical protein ANO11243_041980 [Dothideomycetidae sp. 11243]|nr:hypothetical protein ANO11243_041980 [fungal sp. No.11243]